MRRGRGSRVFCQENMSWLPEYASFNVLRRRFGDVGWNQWPEEYALRKHDALAALLTEKGRELAVEQAVQFFFDEQWRALRAYCAEREIEFWAMWRSL